MEVGNIVTVTYQVGGMAVETLTGKYLGMKILPNTVNMGNAQDLVLLHLDSENTYINIQNIIRITVININCKCGHYQYAHDFGREKCRVRGCKCKEYKEVANE